MTTRHHSYLLDTRRFVRAFRRRVHPGSKLDLRALEEWARSVVASADGATAEALVGLRYEPAWLDPPPGEEPVPQLWSLINLAGSLEGEVPGLSNRLPTSYFVLLTALPGLLGQPARARTFVFGEPLGTLAEGLGSQELREVWSTDRSDSGILSGPAVAERLRSLEDLKLEPRLLEPSARKLLVDHAEQLEMAPAALLRAAIEDLVEMLSSARRRRKGLFLLISQ